MNTPTLLAEGLALSELPDPPVALPPGTYCAMTGEYIGRGYPVSAITTEATNEFLDTFRGGPDGYVSVDVARCFKASNPREGLRIGGSVAVFVEPDGSITAEKPLINREAAELQNRPCWSDYVRSIYPARAGATCCLILATDTKKRLWPQARPGVLGPNTPVLVYDTGSALASVVTVNCLDLLATLSSVEGIYAAGFAKRFIRSGLPGQHDILQQVGLNKTLAWERYLQQLRHTPEFPIALLISQKPAEESAPSEPQKGSSE